MTAEQAFTALALVEQEAALDIDLDKISEIASDAASKDIDPGEVTLLLMEYKRNREFVSPILELYCNGDYDSVISELSRNENAITRQLAASLLGLSGKVEAIPALRRVLAEDREIEVRSAAVTALENIGLKDVSNVALVVKPLNRSLFDDAEALEVRVEAANALAQLGAIEPLSRTLVEGKNAELRRHIAKVMPR